MLRSSLFGAVARGPRVFLTGVHVASVAGIDLLYTGPRLDQADLDVWESCLHRARHAPLTTPIAFTAREFLRSIGRCSGGKDLEWIKNAIRRLTSAKVEIVEKGKPARSGNLLAKYERDDQDQHYVVWVDPEISAFYGVSDWTQVQWEQRLKLKGMALAQWLHGFYATHAKPHPLKVETLHRLCGSETKALNDFRPKLRVALERVTAATGWTWTLGADDLVRVEVVPSRSQRQHLMHRKGPTDSFSGR
jgi:hypothetical protein